MIDIPAILNSPLKAILVVAGIVFLFIAAVPVIQGWIQSDTIGRFIAGCVGMILLSIGLALPTEPANNNKIECVTIINDPNPPINVRKQPNGEILGTLPNKTEVQVKRNEIEWLIIDYQGQDGYIFKKLTKENCQQ